MELDLQRLNHDSDSTIGYLKKNNKFECYTLEDQPQEQKIRSETRIPAGRYEIKKRKVLSGLTKKYREKYDWFEWHLELQNVPNFKYIYIHIGNDDDDTDACILVGYTQTANVKMQTGFIGKSTPCFKNLYLDICRSLDSNEKVFINVKDEY